MVVVLSEEAESNRGYRIVAPAAVEGGEQGPAVLYTCAYMHIRGKDVVVLNYIHVHTHTHTYIHRAVHIHTPCMHTHTYTVLYTYIHTMHAHRKDIPTHAKTLAHTHTLCPE